MLVELDYTTSIGLTRWNFFGDSNSMSIDNLTSRELAKEVIISTLIVASSKDNAPQTPYNRLQPYPPPYKRSFLSLGWYLLIFHPGEYFLEIYLNLRGLIADSRSTLQETMRSSFLE